MWKVSIVQYCPSPPLWTTSCVHVNLRAQIQFLQRCRFLPCQHIRSSLNSHHILWVSLRFSTPEMRFYRETRDVLESSSPVDPVWSLQVFLFPERNCLNFVEGQYLCKIEHQSLLKIHNAMDVFHIANHVVHHIWCRYNQRLETSSKYNYSRNVKSDYPNGTSRSSLNNLKINCN